MRLDNCRRVTRSRGLLGVTPQKAGTAADRGRAPGEPPTLPAGVARDRGGRSRDGAGRGVLSECGVFGEWAVWFDVFVVCYMQPVTSAARTVAVESHLSPVVVEPILIILKRF